MKCEQCKREVDSLAQKLCAECAPYLHGKAIGFDRLGREIEMVGEIAKQIELAERMKAMEKILHWPDLIEIEAILDAAPPTVRPRST